MSLVVVVVVVMVIVCTWIGLSVLSTWQSEATMEAIVGATPSSSISELWDMVGTSVNSGNSE